MTTAPFEWKPSRPCEMALLEDPHEHTVRRPDREQVEDDRLDRDHDRAERRAGAGGTRARARTRTRSAPASVRRRVEVDIARGLAGDRGLHAGEPPDRRRDDLLAEHVAARATEAASFPWPASGMSTFATVRDGLTAVRIGSFIDAGRERAATQVRERRLHLRRVDVRRLDDDRGRRRRARETPAGSCRRSARSAACGAGR